MEIRTVVPQNPEKRGWEIHFTSMSSQEFEHFRCLMYSIFGHGQFDNAAELQEQVSIQRAIIDKWLPNNDKA